MFVRCAVCGDVTGVPSCASCGADLPLGVIDAVSAFETLVAPAAEDQTLADRDQTSGDTDQTSADHDQAASESDQRSSDDDQQASEDDQQAVEQGGGEGSHQRTSEVRERTSRDREDASTLRGSSAAQRLTTGDERDQAAKLRDRGAEHRDALARLHDSQGDWDASREEIRLRAARDRERAAADRAEAADDRARAAAERELAAAERAAALQLRAEAQQAIELAATDALTGARTRQFGMDELARELERAYRTAGTLTLAFIDIDGLKAVNDGEGHLAGDALLQATGKTLRESLRTYDVVLRYGGDEFVCAMPNMVESVARRRFHQIAAMLAERCPDHSISFGLAEAEKTDHLEALIERADEDLLGTRRLRKN